MTSNVSATKTDYISHFHFQRDEKISARPSNYTKRAQKQNKSQVQIHRMLRIVMDCQCSLLMQFSMLRTPLYTQTHVSKYRSPLYRGPIFESTFSKYSFCNLIDIYTFSRRLYCSKIKALRKYRFDCISCLSNCKETFRKCN